LKFDFAIIQHFVEAILKSIILFFSLVLANFQVMINHYFLGFFLIFKFNIDIEKLND